MLVWVQVPSPALDEKEIFDEKVSFFVMTRRKMAAAEE